MSFLIVGVIIFLFFVYFYVFFLLMGRKKRKGISADRGHESASSTVGSGSEAKVRKSQFVVMDMNELRDKVSRWMSQHGSTSSDVQKINEHSYQESFQKIDPVFGTNYLTFVYHCREGHREVPVELLLQFRDCVRMLAYGKGFAVTNGDFPADVDRLFEEAPVVFLHVGELK